MKFATFWIEKIRKNSLEIPLKNPIFCSKKPSPETPISIKKNSPKTSNITMAYKKDSTKKKPCSRKRKSPLQKEEDLPNKFYKKYHQQQL